MNERNVEARSNSGKIPIGEQEIGQLLEAAGRRPEVPPGDLAMIRAAARSEWRELEGLRPQSFRTLVPLAAAASVLLALVVGWWWLKGGLPITSAAVATVEVLQGSVRVEGPREPLRLELAVGEPLVSGMQLATTTGPDGVPAFLAIRLQGGPSVRLDVDTRVRLLSESSLELSEGAVYVDSPPAMAAGGSVEITTPFGTVREVGTQFEVRVADGETGTLRVRVREGAVSILRGTESDSAAAGEELTVRPDGSLSRGTVELRGSVWEWALTAAPSLDIEGLMLSSYFEWVSRETGWQIRYSDEALAESAEAIELHGTIEGLRPDESVSVVLPGSGLDYRLEEGVLLVERPSADGTGG